MSPHTVYFSPVTNIHAHAACALFLPAQNWMLQQDDDVPLQAHAATAQKATRI